MPKRKGGNKHIHDSMVRDHKVYAVDETERTFYYSPREGKWGTGNRGQLVGKPRDWCMIDNLLFCLSRNGTIFWCEPDELDLHGTERISVMNTEEVKGLSSRNHWDIFIFGLRRIPWRDSKEARFGATLSGLTLSCPLMNLFKNPRRFCILFLSLSKLASFIFLNYSKSCFSISSY
ncbi:unnamed protein product [Brassica oleracea]